MRKKVLLTFNEQGKNGGPYISHSRIMESELKEKFDIVPIYFPRMRQLLLPHNFIKYILKIKKVHPDIFHSSGLQFEGFIYVLIAWISGVKNIVVAIRGSSKDAIFLSSNKKRIIAYCEKLSLKLAKAFYSVSDFVGSWEIVQSNKEKYWGTIYNLPDEKIKVDSKFNIREELELTEDDILVVSSGRVTIDKGFELLKDVILKIGPLEKVHYAIVGQGSYLEEMIEVLQESNVHFLGYRNDVPKILDACDIFILCSFHETLCNSAIEASAHGLPCVVSGVGGLREVIVHEETGYLVEELKPEIFARYLNKLIENKELREQLGRKGLDRMDTMFSRRKIIDSLTDLYSSVLYERQENGKS